MKALIRRGDAHLHAEKLDAAAIDFTAAVKLLQDPDVPLDWDSRRSLQASAQQKLRAANELANASIRDSARADAKAPAELLAAHHSKRIYFKFNPPRRVVVGRPFTVAVYVANEFGLHKRGSSSALRLACTTLPRPALECITVLPVEIRVDERGRAELTVTVNKPCEVQLVIAAVDTPVTEVIPLASAPITAVATESDMDIVASGVQLSDDALNCRLFEFDSGTEPIVFVESIGELYVPLGM